MSTAVLAETQAQVLVDDTVELFTPAEKIDEVRAVVEDLQCHIIPGKVIFQGILHKQIFFVNKKNTVVHQRVDIPFSGFVEVEEAQPGQGCQLTAEIAFLEFELEDGKRLREIAVIDITVRLFNNQPLNTMVMPAQQNSFIFRGNPQAFIARGDGKKKSGGVMRR